MEKIKSMLHGKQEGETHHPGDPQYDAAKEARGDKGDEGYGLNDSANSKGAHEGYTRDASDPSLLTGAVGATGASKHPDKEIHLGDSRGSRGAENEMGTGRRAEDVGSARQEYVEDREAKQQREMDSSSGQNPNSLESSAGTYSSTGGQGLQYMDASQLGTYGASSEQPSSGAVGAEDASATGLEQRNPYAAGAQAGGLLDKEDIARMRREDGLSAAPQIGGTPESGFTSQQATGSLADEPMSRRAEEVMRGSSGQQMGGQEAGTSGLRGEEGLIHGHHTTITGENLDPHIRR